MAICVKKNKNYSGKTAFANLEKSSSTLITPKRSKSGIPKYVADRMARRMAEQYEEEQRRQESSVEGRGGGVEDKGF